MNGHVTRIDVAAHNSSKQAREMQEINEGCVLVAYRSYERPGLSAVKGTCLSHFTASDVPSDVWNEVTANWGLPENLQTEPDDSAALVRAVKFVRFLCTNDPSDALRESWFPKNSERFIFELAGGLLPTPLRIPVIAFYSFDSEDIGAEKHFPIM